MASTYTSRLRLELQATGENSTTWGSLANGDFSQIEDAICGVAAVVMIDADKTLTALNGLTDESRMAVVSLTGTNTAQRSVIVPTASKTWIFINGTAGGFPVLVKTVAGTGIVVPSGQSMLLRCDGTNVIEPVTYIAQVRVGALQDAAGGSYVPAGLGPLPYAGATAPAGWLFCYGQQVSRTTYAALFAAIGTAFGVGDGATTFNLPDMRGRVPLGRDDLGGAAASRVTAGGSGVASTTLGGTGGNQLLQAHGHGVTDPTHAHSYTDPSHAHTSGTTVLQATGGQGLAAVPAVIGTDYVVPTIQPALVGITINAAGTGVSIQSAGGGGSQNMPPVLVTNYIIKT